MAEANVPREAIAVYEQWKKAFQSLDAPVMKSLFDADYPGFAYQAEEIPGAHKSSRELAAYWDNALEVVESVPQWDETERHVGVTGDVVTVFAIATVTLKIKGVAKPFTDKPLRTTHVIHKRDGKWKILQYHESRVLDLAAILAAG